MNSPNPSHPVRQAAATVPRSDEEAERCHSRAGELTIPRARSHALGCATMRALLYPVSSAFLITVFALIPGSSSLRGNQR